MRFSYLSGVRNDLLQEIANNSEGVAVPPNMDAPALQWWATYSPHASTLRYTYTVAADRLLVLKSAMIQLLRRTTPSASGFIYAALQIRKTGVGDTSVIVLRMNNGAIGGSKELSIPINVRLEPGDRVRFYTSDSSTGGTVDFQLTVNSEEYDI